MVSCLKFPKEIGRVSDVDWVASDKIVLSVADGYLAITDISLHTMMSPLIELAETGESLPYAASRYVIYSSLDGQLM